MDRSRTYAIVALDQGHGNTGFPPGEAVVPVAGGEASQDTPGLALHYHIPSELAGKVEPGHLVGVLLRGKPAHGVVVGLSPTAPVAETRPLTRLVDPRPVVSPAMLDLARWMADHYKCTLWQALHPMLPPGAARRAITTLGLSDPGKGANSDNPLLTALGRRQQQVISILKAAPRSTVTVGRLKRHYVGAPSGLSTVVRDLERKGLVTSRTELPAPRVKPKDERIVRLSPPLERVEEALLQVSERAPLQAAALHWLLKQTTGDAKQSAVSSHSKLPQSSVHERITNSPQSFPWLRLADLYHHTGATSQTLAALQRKGLVETGTRPVHSRPMPSIGKNGSKDEPPTLTSAQAAAWREIAESLRGSGVGGRVSIVATEDEGRTPNDESGSITPGPRPPIPSSCTA